MKKQASDLTRLSDEEKGMILGWLDEKEPLRGIVEKIAKKAPEGFGVKTNITTLSRMASLWRQEQLVKSRPEQVERARALIAREAEQIELQRGTIAVLHQRLFETAIECKRQAEQRETLRMMLDYQVKMRRLDLQEKKLDLARRQFEFNAARAAMKYWHRFQQIDARKDIDDEEKIWEAREAVFVGPDGQGPAREKRTDPGSSLKIDDR